jgi:hypothetical protein
MEGCGAMATAVFHAERYSGESAAEKAMSLGLGKSREAGSGAKQCKVYISNDSTVKGGE